MATHLRIVAFNDVYALDHLPRLATLVQRAREGADRLLVTLAGDFLAPSVLSSLDDGRGMVACLDAIGVTHVTFGNHEDDVPHRAMLARMAELDAVWLATNVHGVGRALPAHDIVTVGEIRVGLLGVVLTDPLIFRRPPFGASSLEDPQVAALREAALLTGELGCAWVVALTHQTAEADRALARALHGTPAIILGGHEHTALDETIDGTRVIKAGSEATHAAIIDAVWTAPSGPPQVSARLEPVAGYDEAPAVRALVDRLLAPVRALAQATLLEMAPGEAMSSVGIRASQTSVGTLVCSRLRDVLGADACVFNAGGIRGAATYPARFTYGDLEAEVPFDNEVVIVALPGHVLEDAIASSRAEAPRESGGYLQVDDRIAVDPASNALRAVAGAPFDPARTYRVALVRDLCFGLDHLEPLVAYARAHPEAIPPAGGFRTPKELLVRSFAVALWNHLGGFAVLDANHDGRVVPSEVAAALARERHGEATELVGELVVHALDLDHDDAVSPDESDKR